MVDQRSRPAFGQGGNDQEIGCSGVGDRLGGHEMAGAGTNVGVEADGGHIPGRWICEFLCLPVGTFQNIEDGGEPGVEHAVVNKDRYFHGANAINNGVSATDVVDGRGRSFSVSRTNRRLSRHDGVAR
jgi:hypothetical protein